MQSLGEMATLYPSAGAFVELSGRFVDRAVAVALGYNYWYLVCHHNENLMDVNSRLAVGH